MVRYIAMPILVAVAVTTSPMSAQSASAVAGWVSLITTPVGAFAPTVYVPPAPDGERRWGVQARYSHWQFAADDDNTTNLGISAARPAGRGRVSLEVGLTTKKGCTECNAYMIGSELFLPLRSQGNLAVMLNPEVGYARETRLSGLRTLALAVSTPISYSATVGNNATVVPFVAPGVGFGRISAGGSSETGQRLLLGGGVAFVNTKTGLQVTASIGRILIEDGANVIGIALGFGR